jgi:periplasmic protein TonB
MYAIEYPKQTRATPLVITVGIHLVLFYAVAVGLRVVPSLPGLEALQVITVPVAMDPPESVPNEPVDPHINALDLSYLDNVELSPILIHIEQPDIGPVHEPIFETGGGPTIGEAPLINARIKYSPETPYPAVSRIRDEQGTVLVKVMISINGTVGDVQLEKSSGFSRLDDAALKAVRGWKFAPASRGSQAMATWVIVPVKFMLNGRG